MMISSKTIPDIDTDLADDMRDQTVFVLLERTAQKETSCLKRYVKKNPEYGFVVPHWPVRVYLGNVYESTPLLQRKYKDYVSTDEMVNDGWIID